MAPKICTCYCKDLAAPGILHASYCSLSEDKDKRDKDRRSEEAGWHAAHPEYGRKKKFYPLLGGEHPLSIPKPDYPPLGGEHPLTPPEQFFR